jgi:hypothetical protein
MGKKVCEIPSQKPQQKSWAWWCTPVSPVMVGSVKQENCGPGWPGQKKSRLYLQNNQSKKGWRRGSSGRAAACKQKILQVLTIIIIMIINALLVFCLALA